MTLVITESAAKAALKNDDTCASVVLYATEELLGAEWLNWEPASVWLELDRRGVSISTGNREQLMAARNLLTTGRFWYDALVFEKTCIAFNNEEINVDALDDAPIAFIAWAAWEALEILRHNEINEDVSFDREVIAYTGVQLFREGFVIAPVGLGWAQAALDNYLPKYEVKPLQATLREAWAAAPQGQKLYDAAFPETPEGVQLARLATVQSYFDTRTTTYLKDMAQLQA